MAARPEVTPTWLSRYLQLARLWREVIDAFPSIREIRELHARPLKPHLGRRAERDAILEEARAIAGGAGGLDAAAVMARLRSTVATPRAKIAAGKAYRRAREESGVTVRQKGAKVTMEFGTSLSRSGLEAAFDAYIRDRFGA